MPKKDEQMINRLQAFCILPGSLLQSIIAAKHLRRLHIKLWRRIPLQPEDEFTQKTMSYFQMRWFGNSCYTSRTIWTGWQFDMVGIYLF